MHRAAEAARPDRRSSGRLHRALGGDRRAAGRVADGGVGAFNRRSVQGLEYTVANVHSFLDDLEAMGGAADHISLYALLNETIIEGQFGLQAIMSQADNPTQFQHAGAKPKADRHAVNLMATTAFAMSKSDRRAQQGQQYQQPEVGTLDASAVLREVALAHQACYPRVVLGNAERAVEEAALVDMKVLAVNAHSQRCSTTRSRYRRPCGVNPTILPSVNPIFQLIQNQG